jgi:putative N6-adenine-specific DNA methylase
LGELERKAGLIDWKRSLPPGTPVQIRVTSKKSRLYHQKAIAERIGNAIAAAGFPLAVREAGGDDDESAAGDVQLLVVRLLRDECTISLDSSGELLHRRGYRLATAKAPLRETLAAAMLLASGWDGSGSLLDPFCGSGTIPIGPR